MTFWSTTFNARTRGAQRLVAVFVCAATLLIHIGAKAADDGGPESVLSLPPPSQNGGAPAVAPAAAQASGKRIPAQSEPGANAAPAGSPQGGLDAAATTTKQPLSILPATGTTGSGAEDLAISPEPANLRVNPKSDEEDGSRLRYVPLYIGIETEERLPYLPKKFTVKGDFRKIANVSVARASSTLRFVAKKEGVATLSIHNAKGFKIYEFRIDSKKTSLTKVAREIRALLSDIEGIQIKIVNNRVVVDGLILLPRDMDRVHGVVKQFNGLADTLVRLSPVAQKKIAQLIANQINNPEVQVTAVNDKFILEGSVASKDDKDRAYIIAQLYVPDIIKTQSEADGVVVPLRKEYVINLLTVRPDAPPEPGKPIQLVVHYVELNKSYNNSFRFDFSPGLADGSNVSFSSDSRAPGGIVSTITGTISNLLPKLNWAKSHGLARILESTSIIVLNKQQGKLSSTTQIPFPTSTGIGQAGTGFADAGIKSEITPDIISPRSDNIRLMMKFEMSALVDMVDNRPIISRNQIETIVIVRSGQSAAVGGLITNSTNTDYNKLPRGQNDNPIISLYASKAFQRNQSQFVVFITPIIKSSASSGAEKIKKKMRLRDG